MYVRPPPEGNCPEGYVWILKKCVYGLTDASLKWYLQVKKVMTNLGGKISDVDPALFTWYEDGILIGMTAVHVDDFLWSGNNYFESMIIPHIRENFSVGREEEKTFKYLGMNIQQKEKAIIIDQLNYINGLHPISIDDRGVDRTLTKDEQDILRYEIGQLLWVSNQTRPDICFDTANLAVNISKSTTKGISNLNKVINKLKKDSYVLTFKHLKKPVKIVVYTDAAFGNLPDGGSQVFLVPSFSCT